MNNVAHKDSIHNVNIVNVKVLITPSELKAKLPLPTHLRQQIEQSRRDIANIIHKKDPRLLVVIGPCSIHDPLAAIDYAKKLKALADEVKDQLYIVMRVYFEKPRTTVGWKGLINDPKIDGSFDVEHGLHIARQLLLELAEMGLPLATEALDPITPQYMADLFSWSAIGARTTESQTHRELASGLSMAVGFKNGTDGSIATAINAMKASAMGHSFIGINQQGQVNLLHTAGNPDGHIILRGGKAPNYQAEFVQQAEQELQNAGLEAAIMVDCSHGNSNKDYRRQPIVVEDVIQQIVNGNQSIIGVMLESHLNAGNQSAEQPVSEMQYGVSITDACIDWATSEQLLRQMTHALANKSKSL
ncbi:3-deoxy-7-phosphoheptulonate synthase [Avibacterium paragallinarum]|uniref:Phospho-2-dehydro-3-deoxyheptonate aldolase n=1 Tax=Avibacterium paragallinarum TaxID=728 RepID=A0A0F5EXE8_AVIPA|nr:3-deoxy-7-phosphoheptulonate synthase [Avibacterium paragallinarum]KAA6208674.1 3-deoxy-7-phosphoheptulonate synthase [Avibacterium paragallinarum]KKB01035.1 phospho-2-dehydro-3-deoxyheptonate aldolase [Avibacterium paragallinarum]RZN57491.1 3-deoxy-7-phosphoheptulonate synthase [Avibacterium paragallinarum]RZN70311.1 3-deoxy-7-phosphoheptulonate synthase [Avibacterium paragallinarum]SUU97641.1 Phospho-2-dehydro-3-deoxyheptonate aldolase, Tyr-sensitive [Avibacterium paragallinarum]